MLAIRVIDQFTELADVLSPFDDSAFLRWDDGQGKVVGGEVESGDVTGALGYTPENPANKATDFNTVNNTLYPSVQAVRTAIDAAVVGLFDDRGNFDASGNVFPSSGGSGTAGAILKGDMWFISVAGTLGGAAVGVGDQIRALVDTPGQTAGNWAISEANIGYVPENVNNKATGFGTLNNTLYPTTQAVANYAQPKSDRLTEVATIGSASQQIRVNAGGTQLEYFTPTAGANAALSNLASVAVSESLIAGATGKNLGSAAIPWARLFVGPGTAANDPDIKIGISSFIWERGSGYLALGSNSGQLMEVNVNGLFAKHDKRLGFYSSGDPGTPDTVFMMVSSGLLELNNGTLGQYRDLVARTYFLSGTTVKVTSGSGSPESAVTGAVGSLYLRTDGGANTTLYVKESGSGNTGWIAK